MNFILASISSGQITNYVNLALLVIAAIGLIGFFIGLIKGFWLQTFTLVCTIVLLIGMILLLKPISNWLYDLDISSLLSQSNVSLPSEDIKSIGDLVEYNIVTALTNANLDYSNAEIVAFASGICLSVIRFILYFVLLIVVLILGSILIPLFYLLFKLIIPKVLRKRKLRLLGGLSGFVEFIIIFCMFINPLTAMVNSTVGKIRDENGNIVKNEEVDNESYDLVYNVLDGYNNSILAKALFSLSSNGKSIDFRIMDYVTLTKVGEGVDFHFYDELGQSLAIVYETISTGAIDLSTMAINYDILVNSTLIKNVIYTLSDSTLVLFALPLFVSIGLNSSKENLDIDLSDIDLSNVDWSDSLKAVGDVFEAIKSTGYIQIAMSSPDDILNQIIISKENETYLKDAMKRIGDSSFVSTLLPQVMVSYFKSMNNASSESEVSTMKSRRLSEEEGSETSENKVNYKDLFKNLPEEAYNVETYKNIRWGDELSSIIGIMFNMADQVKSIEEKQDISIQELMTTLENFDPIKLFLGYDNSISYTTKDQFKDNVFLNGGKYNGVDIPGTNGILGLNENTTGLLNLQVSNLFLDDFGLMSKFVKTLFTSLLGQDESIFVSIEDNLAKLSFNDWKKELSAMLSLALPLIVATNDLANSEDVFKTIGDKGSGVNLALSYIGENMEQSVIINNVVPNVISDMLSEEKDTPIFMNLTVGDLNFNEFTEDTNFAKQFTYLVDEVIPSANKILSAETFNLEYVVKNSTDVAKLFEKIYASQILNNQLVEEDKNTNFENIMISIFSPLKEDEDASLNIPTMTNGLFSIEKDSILSIEDSIKGWVNEKGDGEIISLFNVIGSIDKDDELGSTEYLFDYLKNSSMNINNHLYDMGNEIERIFSSVDESILMKEALPNTLNKMFDSNDSLKGFVHFENIDSFEEEGKNLSKALNAINEVKGTNSETDISILIQNCDTGLLKEYEFTDDKEEYSTYEGSYPKYFMGESKAYNLLNSINDTKSIDMQGLLYSTIQNIFKDSSLVSTEALKDSEADFKFEKDIVNYNSTIKVNWSCTENPSGYYGEIYNLSRVFVYSTSINNLTSLDNNDFNEVLNVVMKAYPLRSLVGPIVSNGLKQISNNSESDIFQSLFNESYCDYNAIDKMNYIDNNEKYVNRYEEEKARLNEVYSIYTLYVNSSKFSSDINSVLDLTENKENSILSTMLFALHNSEIFNSSELILKVDNSIIRTNLTSFENLFIVLVDKTENKGFQGLLYADDLYELNNRLSNNTETYDKWLGNGSTDIGEVVKFNNDIKTLNGISNESSLEAIVDIAKCNIESSLIRKVINRYVANQNISYLGNKIVGIDFDKPSSNPLDRLIYES